MSVSECDAMPTDSPSSIQKPASSARVRRYADTPMIRTSAAIPAGIASDDARTRCSTPNRAVAEAMVGSRVVRRRTLSRSSTARSVSRSDAAGTPGERVQRRFGASQQRMARPEHDGAAPCGVEQDLLAVHVQLPRDELDEELVGEGPAAGEDRLAPADARDRDVEVVRDLRLEAGVAQHERHPLGGPDHRAARPPARRAPPPRSGPGRSIVSVPASRAMPTPPTT